MVEKERVIQIICKCECKIRELELLRYKKSEKHKKTTIMKIKFIYLF